MPDDDGYELPDLEAAKRIGLEVLGEILRFSPAEFWGSEKLKLRIGNSRDPRQSIYTLAVRGEPGGE